MNAPDFKTTSTGAGYPSSTRDATAWEKVWQILADGRTWRANQLGRTVASILNAQGFVVDQRKVRDVIRQAVAMGTLGHANDSTSTGGARVLVWRLDA